MSRPLLFTPSFLIAVGVALLLGAALIAGTFLLIESPTGEVVDPVEAEETTESPVAVLQAPREEVPSPPPLELLPMPGEELHAPRQEEDAPKRPDFSQHLEAGRVAFAAGRYADALREYLVAQRMRPEDLEAEHGVKQARMKLALLAGQEKRKAAFADLLDQAAKALKGRRYKDGLAAIEPAVEMEPGDREAQRLHREAKEGLKSAKSANAKMLAEANEAARVGKFERARQLVEEAVKNWPEDSQAERLLPNATRLAEIARTEAAIAGRLAQQGLTALNAVAMEREVRWRPTYLRLAQAGNTALSRRAYGEAIKHFSEALTLFPEDLTALEGLRKARYGRAMVEGQMALQLRRRADAMAAFEMALAEAPNDPLAKQGMRQAQILR